MIRSPLNKKFPFFFAIACVISLSAETWDSPLTIDSTSLELGLGRPHIAVNDSENGLATWIKIDNLGSYNICSSSLSGGNWSPPTIIDGPLPYPEGLQMDLNNAGQGFAIWTFYDGNYYWIKAAPYDGSSWGSSQLLSLTGTSFEPQIHINATGHAAAVWTFDDGSDTKIHASLYTPLSNWSSPETISSDPAAKIPRIGLSDLGTSIASWAAYDGVNDVVQYAIYNSLWNFFTTLSNNNNYAGYPTVAVNTLGNGIITWEAQVDEGYTEAILASKYAIGVGANSPQIISSTATISFSSDVAFNDLGNALAIWNYYDGSNFQIGSWNLTSETWSNPTVITTPTSDNLSSNISLNNNDVGCACWIETNNFQIQTNTFSSGSWGSPTTVSAGISSFEPELSTNNLDHAYVIWTALGETGYYIQVAKGSLP